MSGITAAARKQREFVSPLLLVYTEFVQLCSVKLFDTGDYESELEAPLCHYLTPVYVTI